MSEHLQVALKISLLFFTVGNLLDMGLRIDVKQASAGLRNPRFVGLVLLTSFLFGPAIAFLTTLLLPVSPPYAVGLMLLSLAPGAPFLPVMAEKARGDLNYAGVYTLIAVLGTVVFMPLGAPLLVEGLKAGAWALARPLLLLVLLPLAIGMAVRAHNRGWAERVHPTVRAVTNIATIIMLILCVPIYGRGFIGSIGTFAIASQAVFFSAILMISHFAGIGLRSEQRTILTLGNLTRNVGAALAPLLEIADFDQRTIVMVVLAVPMQIAFAWGAARFMAARSAKL